MPGSSKDRVRIDSRDWRVALHEGPEDDLAYVGFEVATSGELRELEQRISDMGARRIVSGSIPAAGASHCTKAPRTISPMWASRLRPAENCVSSNNASPIWELEGSCPDRFPRRARRIARRPRGRSRLCGLRGCDQRRTA